MALKVPFWKSFDVNGFVCYDLKHLHAAIRFFFGIRNATLSVIRNEKHAITLFEYDRSICQHINWEWITDIRAAIDCTSSNQTEEKLLFMMLVNEYRALFHSPLERNGF